MAAVANMLHEIIQMNVQFFHLMRNLSNTQSPLLETIGVDDELAKTIGGMTDEQIIQISRNSFALFSPHISEESVLNLISSPKSASQGLFTAPDNLLASALLP